MSMAADATQGLVTELNWKFSRDDNSSVHERVAAITMVRLSFVELDSNKTSEQSHPPIECVMVA